MAGPQQRYQGVRQRHWGSWVSKIRHPLLKTRIWLGTFETTEDAARAYDEASRIMCGTRARTNFSYDGEPSSVKFLSATLMSKLQKCHIASLRMTKRTALSKQDNPDERKPMNMKNDENGANNRFMSRKRSDENKSMEDDQIEQMIQELLANGSIDIELLSDHGKMKNVGGMLY